MNKKTGKIININGMSLIVPNDIINGKNNKFYISYNNRDISIYGNETTALVIESEKRDFFYILNGDHTEEYKKMKNSLKNCLNYYKKNKNLINNFSDQLI